MWVSGAMNIKDYTETVTLAITDRQLFVIRIMMSDRAYIMENFQRPWLLYNIT